MSIETAARRDTGTLAGHGKTRTLVKTVGIVAIVLGGIATLDIIAYMLICVYVQRLGYAELLLVLMRFDVAMSVALAVAKLVAGCGILMLRRWGRTTALAAFSIEYLIGFMYAIAFCINCYHIRNIAEPLYDALTSQAVGALWPLWVQSFIALLLVALLSRESVRLLFSASTPPASTRETH